MEGSGSDSQLLLNFRLTASITYHNPLHGFWVGRGTGTATLEVKLLQKVASMKEAALHAIFLDLHKAYYALDRSRCLEILEGYGVGPRDLRLLLRYWERLHIVARAEGYYVKPFHVDRGVTQGDPLSPTILNMVVYMVVYNWDYLMAERAGGGHQKQ